jgi:hypothetical protein
LNPPNVTAIIFTENRNSLGNTNEIKGLRMKKSLSDTAQQHYSRHTAVPIQVDAAGSAGTGAQVITRQGKGKGRGLSPLLPNLPPNVYPILPRCLL